MINGKIIHMSLHTPKHLTIHIKPLTESYSWIAGQWLDFTVPKKCLPQDKQSSVAGYSFCSPTGSGEFELLVRKSRHPVSQWLFEKGQVGDQVLLGEATGDCTYDPNNQSHLVCIAGGVGITPLISMIRTAVAAAAANPTLSVTNSATLYHCVKDRSELLFTDEIPNENLFISSEKTRISFNDIGKKHGVLADYFLCGPTDFIDSGESKIKSLGCEKVHFERWW
mmetsp:Transcript_21253/g.24465  ORF Transcript_21253/g.24465 Transcript_21253/m.24465 type:complete len:224 (-) Transcript_21253:70-741(-)